MGDTTLIQVGNLVFDDNKNLCKISSVFDDLLIYSIMEETDWSEPIYKELKRRIKYIPFTMNWARNLLFEYDEDGIFSRMFGTVKYAFLPDEGLHYYSDGSYRHHAHECNMVHEVQNQYKWHTGTEMNFNVWADYNSRQESTADWIISIKDLLK